MARAHKRKWVNLVAGLLVGAAAQSPALLAGPDAGLPILQQPSGSPGGGTAPRIGGPSRAHLALNAAIDAQRQGDFDKAADLFREAQARQTDLTPDERRELGRLLAANGLAMQARRETRERLSQAEAALQQGRSSEAGALLKRISASELYLAGGDKQRFQMLCQKLHVPASGPAAPAANAAAQAHAKLQQARAAMAHGDLSGAEAMAREADQLHATFGAHDDSPRRVLDDLDKAQKDPKGLLNASRAALKRGDFEQAEKYAHAADKASSAFTFAIWSDSPSKALKDIQAARASAGPATGSALCSPDTEKARALIRQGYQAVGAGDFAQARKCAEQATALKADLHWVEDNPAKLLDDIARAERARGGAAPAAPAEPASLHTKEEALTLLQKGREQLTKGDIDEANKTAARLRAAKQIRWGLFFEDTPDKLQADVDRARTQRNKDKSVELMAEARRSFDKKDYDAAEKLSCRAQALHGAYSIWDLGDRPSKLMAEIESARSKERRVKLPEAPTVAKDQADLSHGPLANPANKMMAQGPNANDPNRPGMTPSPALTPPGPFNTTQPANVAQARQLMHDARLALRNGDTTRARLLADQASNLRVAWAPGDDTPETIYRELAGPATPRPPMGGPTPGALLASQQRPAARPTEDPLANGARARQLVAEARALQRQGHLAEARDKVVEAQRLGLAFRPDEDNPDQLFQQIAFQARQQIDGLLHHAGETIRAGTQAPAVRCQAAEMDIARARQLASAFGLDMQPIERARMQVAQLRGSGGVTLVSGQAPVGDMLPPAGADKGASARGGDSDMARAQQLLDQARMELRSGETATARRLAEEACNRGARDQGLAVLRSIDTEEFNQRRLRTNQAFGAVMAAYKRRDFRQAGILLAALDTKLLDEARQARLREIVSTPEMQPVLRAGGAGVPPVALVADRRDAGPTDPGASDHGTSPTLRTQMDPPTPAAGGAGHARATDSADQSLLAHTRALREVKFQQLRSEGMEVQSQALERFRSGQTEAAVDMLQDYLTRLSEEQLDPGQLTLLRRPVESRVQQFRLMKAQVDFANQSSTSMRVNKDQRLKAANAEQVKQKNVADLMRQYNDLFKLGKYTEAEALAMRAKELDPDNPMATAAVTIARTQRRKDEYRAIKDGKEVLFVESMNDAENESGSAEALKHGISFNPDAAQRERINKRSARDSLDALHMPRKSNEERNIERKLTTPVSLNFTNAPLKQVIDDLRAYQGVNIYVDEPALAEKGIDQNQPVTIKLDQIALKSALNLLLHSAHLTYVVRDDVLQITTEDHARGKLEQKVYQVTDLVLAVENFGQVGVTPANQLGIEAVNQPITGAPSPVTGPYTLNGGQPVGSPMGSGAGGAAAGGFASDPRSALNAPQVVKSRAQTNEDMLIKLITNTISPKSWGEQGGPGTIDYFPLTMSLVINQTPDIQDQVADLLAALRRLQDQEVAVEVKFISISEDFFERIGVNFNLNIVNKGSSKYQPQLTSGEFQQPNFINQFAPSQGFLTGLTPAGTLTSDLNIPLTQTTYQQAIPPFGGYPGVPGYGGLTLGLAFLSDIQVFLFMEAVQGDIRANVMQAPKLTLFNGQTATILVQDFQFFVVGVQVVPQLGQFTYFPQTSLFPLGISLTIQAVISADRRFVRLSLTPSLSNLVNGEVLLFPVVTPIFPLFDGTSTGQPVVFTQFVQQPRLTRVSVQTTVAVPDGGTVLMGGLKRLSEGRNEFGPPVLSKVPYLNRLFQNRAYGRSAESLLIMVTPRIIIQAEEEEKQTGYVPPAAVVP